MAVNENSHSFLTAIVGWSWLSETGSRLEGNGRLPSALRAVICKPPVEALGYVGSWERVR